ncbi:Nicotinate-nucleotide--dimethylbenzimidazole phosphoribosyltransferase [Candidatus Desulfarcum epimagneticum]|uniref:Nicotinate-nucleotide--dimethylbenzimidazole phosphoribosyltransferase n=1 Tax=uncultured Desulfobacteraceae bacterium TaxID=218296 RepID=A0A484HF84_9BACT|nr:Nicotinate-nucleotide--dimethylbenzimidazole phosphoribosyltransferase [uncultured Desulfobacteraceae bacterium]
MTLNDILAGIEPLDDQWSRRAAAERTERLVMPPRALGRLHDIGERLCAISRGLDPRVDEKAVLVMAADHGVAGNGVSAYPQEVTGAMVTTFLAGGAGINAISRHVGARVRVVDVGVIPDIETSGTDPGLLHVEKVGRGTADFTQGPAMSREDAEKSVMIGFERASALFKEGLDILGTGDMGIGNTSPSAAVGMAITGKGSDEMTGPGTGVDAAGLERKKEAIRRGLELNRPDPKDGLDVLSKVGGFEIGAIAGSILAAAFHKKPVVVDGFISTAGALIAHALSPASVGYMFAGHCSREPGHVHMLGFLGIEPILSLGLRLGEGTGAALAMGVIEAAVKVFKEVMTFEEAGVPDP